MGALRVLTVPFDAGVEGERMGAGPDALVAAGLIDRLREHHDVHSVRIGPAGPWRTELQPPSSSTTKSPNQCAPPVPTTAPLCCSPETAT